MAYYVLKPVREALILGGGSAELKTYMSAAQVVVLAFVVPFYGRLVDRMDRQKRLINVGHDVLRGLPGGVLRARTDAACRWGWSSSCGLASSI